MNGDTQSGVDFIAALLDFARVLETKGYAVYDIDSNLLIFGSFIIVVGTRKRRLKLSWDGRDGFLDVSESYFADSGSQAQWNHKLNKRLGFISNKELFDSIWNEIKAI